MVYLLSKDRSYISQLETVSMVGYERESNEIHKLSITIPNSDPHFDKIVHFGFIEVEDYDGEKIGLYRVMPSLTSNNYPEETTSFTCYHAISTISDSVYFGILQMENQPARDVFQALLDAQKIAHWRLGTVEATQNLSIDINNSNDLVEALYGLLNQLTENYSFSFDTDSYPWTLNVVRVPDAPVCRIKEGYNMLGFEINSDPSNMINRVYAVGGVPQPEEYSEGQEEPPPIDITVVNPTGKPYVQDDELVALYGPREYIYENTEILEPSALLTQARRVLTNSKDINVVWTCKASDLSKLVDDPIFSIDRVRINTVVRVETEKFGDLNMIVRGESKRDMFNHPEDATYVLYSGKIKPRYDITTIHQKLNEQNKKFDSAKRSVFTVAKETATKLINSGFGGYVRVYPDRILIMDQDREDTAQNVWQFNKNGIGHSDTGIAGPYTSAWTQDGHFNIDQITAGTITLEKLHSDVGKYIDIESNEGLRARVTKTQILTDSEIQEVLKGDKGDKGEDTLPMTTHYAWADSPDGKTGFSRTDSTKKYRGQVVAPPLNYLMGEVEGYGRNLALGTATEGWDVWSTANITFELPRIHVQSSRTTSGFFGIQQSTVNRVINLQSDVEYTLSFKARGNISRFNYVYIMNTGASNQGIFNAPGNNVVSSETEWSTIQFTFRPASDTAGNGQSFILIATRGESTSDWFEIKDVKLEKGSTPTDWTPSPEDLDFPESYVWSQVRGEKGAKGDPGTNGIPGAPGEDGRTPYFHIAYALGPDGQAGFSTSDASGKTYIGQYTDFVEEDSTDPTKYKWTKIKGEDGEDVDPELVNNIIQQIGDLEDSLQDVPDEIIAIKQQQTLLEQRADAFALTVKEGGGLNLLKNSVGYAGLKYWTTSGVITAIDNWMLTDTVSKHGFALTTNPSNMLQNVTLKSRVRYTIAFMADIPPGRTLTCELGSLNELEEFEYTTVVEISEEGIFASRYEFESTGAMSVKFAVTGEGEQVEISDIMLSQGNSQDVWTQANGEIYTMNVLIDEDGLSIFRDDESKTVMSPLEFAGYYRDERVFSLNKDITEVAGLLVKTQGLYIPPVKMVQNTNVSLDIVWTGG